MAFSKSILLAALLASQVSSLAIRKPEHLADGEYDFIIGGGGTAGMVLANRLTESGKHTVLVLEAGPEPGTNQAYLAPGSMNFITGSGIDWGFYTAPQKHLNNRTLPYFRGRVGGGCSAINGMYYARGSASVYEHWESLGNPGWGWDNIWPLHVKSTTIHPPDPRFDQSYKTYDSSAYSDGPLELAFQGLVPETANGFIEALPEAAGIPIVEDLNLGNGVGVRQGTTTMDDKFRRSSSYDGYYKRAAGRPNLTVRFNAPVRNINIDTTQSPPVANGVAYYNQRDGYMYTATAKKEVIVTMGSFQSSQLLMISGIGPAEELHSNGIEPIVVNENVGRNIQDHNVFSIYARVQRNGSFTQDYANVTRLQEIQEDFEDNMDGIYTAPTGATNGFQMLSEAELRAIGAEAVIDAGLANQTHIEYLYEADWYPSIPAPYYAPFGNESYISLTASSMVALSRGSVSLRSSSMMDAPIIDPNYYSHPTDRAVGITAFRYLRKILAHPALAKYTIPNGNNTALHGEVAPGATVDSDDDDAIFEYIQANTWANWHAAGSNQMLPLEKGGVVDSRLRVYGVSNLRVADVSIMPVLPDVNILSGVYAVAERGAELIREDHGDL